MPLYTPVKKIKNKKERTRTAQKLLALKESLNEIPVKTLDKNILIATWNIREFDSAAYGKRSTEAMAYIAEIIDRFDLVAVQEVRDDLVALNKLMYMLGKWWKCVYTDVTEGKGGNKERLAFLYDSRKLKFSGLSGEVVIPPIEIKEKGKKIVYQPSEQLFRTPFLVGFQAGWFKFMISTVHIIYGESKNDSPKRVKEIEALSDFLAKRVRGKTALFKNLILLGDFNIFKPSNKTFKEIDKNFNVPEALQSLPSNAIKNKHYDQIAYKFMDDVKLTNAGVFDCFKTVYTLEDEAQYAKNMGDSYLKSSKGVIRTPASQSKYYKTYWRTHQISDHLPMWAEFEIDFSDKYLKKIIG